MALTPGFRLGPYEVLSPLGAGGMGEVYRARDARLDRDVAIKVLPESVAGDEHALARFEREAKAVAALSHPNILALHDVGNDRGIAYAVMELLDGQTLRERLESGAIPRAQAVDYGLQIARGLTAAHERGVVHRDLKPENLFVSKDGHVKILDFGLAKRDAPVAPGEETSAPTATGHTEPGTVMGTVGYMSPEQVRGLAVDHRSDIFSFGAILYEMLSGQRAFKKATPADTMSAILNQEPPELTDARIPVSLDHVVKHCLEKDRDRRFQSARDIEFALGEASGPMASVPRPAARTKRALITVAALVAIAVVAGILLARRAPRRQATSAVKRIAVLPFENLGAPEDDYFADGIADAVRGKLIVVPGVEVIARDSSNAYRKTPKSLQQISQELDTRYFLKATVRWQKSGGTSEVRVNPELVEVRATGPPASKWQQPFDAPITNVFAVQSDIATKVTEALGVALGSEVAKGLRETPTANLPAYDAFLKAEQIAWENNVAVRKALALYEQAVALDPGFARAWVGVSKATAFLFVQSAPTQEMPERSRTAAETALRLDPSDYRGHLALGNYFVYLRNDLAQANAEYSQAVRLAPRSAEVVQALAWVDFRAGRHDAALKGYEEAMRLSPRSIDPLMGLGTLLMFQRRYPEARSVFERLQSLRAPGTFGAAQDIAESYLGEGDLARARAVVRATMKEVEPTAFVAQLANIDDLVWLLDEEQTEILLRLTPSAFDDDRAIWAMCLAQAYALRGDEKNVRKHADDAKRSYEEQLGSASQHPFNNTYLGLALAYLGRKEEAIREGERGVANLREGETLWIPGNRYILARILVLVGEPEKAIDHLEALTQMPDWRSRATIRIDPNFAPLRGNPRFEKLVASK